MKVQLGYDYTLGLQFVIITNHLSTSLEHLRSGHESAYKDLTDGGSSSWGQRPQAWALLRRRVAGMLPAEGAG